MTIPSNPPYVKTTNFILDKDGDIVSINRRPAFSDSTELFKNRVFDDTNDIIISFRDDLWPKYEVLNVDIFPITKAESDAVETFMITHVGELIVMTYNNISYSGIIQEPKLEIIDEKSDNCNYKVSFIFETQVTQ